jgi:hypothetical protein
MGDGAVTIYEQLRRAGCEMDSHEPDLYVKLTPLSSAILNCNFQYPDVFVSDRDGTLWYEIPFGYEPLRQRSSHQEVVGRAA